MIKYIDEIDYINTFCNYKVTINPFTKILAYILDDKIVGFLDYNLMYEKVEINYIFVKEEFRNNKIAYKLISYMINNNRFDNITLEVNVNNIYAIKLYNSLGFKIISTRKNYYNGEDAYLMEVK